MYLSSRTTKLPNSGIVFRERANQLICALELTRSAVISTMDFFEEYAASALDALANVSENNEWRLDLFQLALNGVPSGSLQISAWKKLPFMLASFSDSAKVKRFYEIVA